jgi:hypothetical protein
MGRVALGLPAGAFHAAFPIMTSWVKVSRLRSGSRAFWRRSIRGWPTQPGFRCVGADNTDCPLGFVSSVRDALGAFLGLCDGGFMGAERSEETLRRPFVPRLFVASPAGTRSVFSSLPDTHLPGCNPAAAAELVVIDFPAAPL